ncbi:hypothetical protein [Tunturiibacter gelidiferens]|uniref:hypothetical protein n=1 Tax=Tunturiibacter gelidiferens TaxID=3069689 RepID=UPI003D9AE9A7
MSNDRREVPAHNLDHIRIETFIREGRYSPPPRSISAEGLRRNNVSHGHALSGQLSAAYARAKSEIAAMRTDARDAADIEAPGVYLELHSAQNADISDFQWEQKGIRIGALKQNQAGVQSAALLVPNQASAFLEEKLTAYGRAVEGERRPANEAKVANIQTISEATLQTLWTDLRALPVDFDELVWWECWVWRGGEKRFHAAAQRLEIRVSDRHLIFPEVTLLPVYANTSNFQRLLALSGSVEQVRYASDSPAFFTRTAKREQPLWVEDLVARVFPRRLKLLPSACSTMALRVHILC